MHELDSIDYKILEELKDKEQKTTYDISKSISIGWSTTKIHLLKLKTLNKIDSRDIPVYLSKKTVWWLIYDKRRF